MKRRSNSTTTKPATRQKRLAVIGAVTLTLVVVGIVAAVNRDEVPSFLASNGVANAQAQRQSEAPMKNRNYVTSNASGQTVVVDRQTGQSRPLTPDEARTLAEGIKQLVNQSTDGLVQIHHAGGMVSMDLQGRFQNVLLAKKESDGTVSQSCVNDLEAAANFFEIDPALLGVTAPVSKSAPDTGKLPIR
jgi:hypothetical protein